MRLDVPVITGRVANSIDSLVTIGLEICSSSGTMVVVGSGICSGLESLVIARSETYAPSTS